MDIKLGNILIEEDKRANDFPLVSTPIPMAILIGTYLVIVKYLGPRFMKNRKAYDLKLFISFYNVAQIIACAFLIRESFLSGFKLKFIFECQIPDLTVNPKSMRMLRTLWLTMCLKGFEFTETFVFILRKKESQASTLHVYHHISTFFLAWYCVKYVGGGMLIFSIVLNSVVHMVMYTYYFLAAFGPKVQSKLGFFKKSITVFQMAQFIMILINCFAALLPSCSNPRTSAFLCIYCPNVIFLFYMFYSFYQKAYNQKSGKREQGENLEKLK